MYHTNEKEIIKRKKKLTIKKLKSLHQKIGDIAASYILRRGRFLEKEKSEEV